MPRYLKALYRAVIKNVYCRLPCTRQDGGGLSHREASANNNSADGTISQSGRMALARQRNFIF